jgi:hypothetical protein
MQAGSTDLRWYSAAAGQSVMQLSGTDGSLSVFQAATFSSNVSVSGTLSIGGQPAATKPWVAGHFDGTTAASVPLSSDTGQRTITSVSRTSVGVYVVSWTGAHPRGVLYQVFANMNATAGFLSWDRTSTSLTLRAFTNTALPQDPAEIDFMIP